MKKWVSGFRRGRIRTSGDERSGRPKEIVTPEVVYEVHGMFLDGRRIKVREIAVALNISTERVHHNLQDYFDMKKLSAR